MKLISKEIRTLFYGLLKIKIKNF